MNIKKANRDKGVHSRDYIENISGLRSDKDFKYSIVITLTDGAVFLLPSCYIEHDKEFYFVVEEHHGRFAFEKELIIHCNIMEL